MIQWPLTILTRPPHRFDGPPDVRPDSGASMAKLGYIWLENEVLQLVRGWRWRKNRNSIRGQDWIVDDWTQYGAVMLAGRAWPHCDESTGIQAVRKDVAWILGGS